MRAYADLHLHSPYSIGVSRSLTPAALIDACSLKGITVLGSGDALHPEWRRSWLAVQDPHSIIVIPSAEVEDAKRIHHLILMEDFASFATLAESLGKKTPNVCTGGRPHIPASGEEIARMVHDLGGLIGPAHAFTPWTALYASCNHVAECYGSERIDYLELGLSADTSYGAGIRDLYGVPFLSNSDAHSASPLRFGREFNRLELTRFDVPAVLEAVREGRISMNAGLFPEEGKYNRTACSRCFEQYPLEDAVRYAWRCPKDRGRIKKGVFDRARELTDGDPLPRPRYCHMIPLGEIIQKVLGDATPSTKRCRALYDTLLGPLGPEIDILIRRSISEIGEIDPRVASAIDALRTGRVRLTPGGGGRYGTFDFTG
ncbi:MAG: endonuclease Q family protein [Methanomicrobiales archaeon]|nr:endonuclease Q family protein [Methanomicrobiales archaeon]